MLFKKKNVQGNIDEMQCEKGEFLIIKLVIFNAIVMKSFVTKKYGSKKPFLKSAGIKPFTRKSNSFHKSTVFKTYVLNN